MKKNFLLTMVSIVAVSASIFAANAFAAKKPKISICHQTGADKYIVINVSENAADAHFINRSIGHDDPEVFVDLGDGTCAPDVAPPPPPPPPPPPIE